jgi:hypothetical protein
MLEASHDLVFRNSFKDIHYALDTLYKTGIRCEFESPFVRPRCLRDRREHQSVASHFRV